MTAGSEPPDLRRLRLEIDVTDREILALLGRRGRLVLELASAKRSAGLAVHDAAREARLLEALGAADRGPWSAAALERIFATIVQASRELQA